MAISVGNKKQLFIDNRFIDISREIKIKVNPPIKAETVLKSEMPWEGYSIYGATVIRNEDGYHMWYHTIAGLNKEKTKDPIICDKCSTLNEPGIVCCKKCGHELAPDLINSFTCYASSEDGLKWERPNLGLVEYEGSKNNNIIIGRPEAPFMTPEGFPFRYISLSGCKNALTLLASNDGFKWEKIGVGLPFTCDSQNQIIWDMRIGKFVVYLRGFNGKRNVVRCEIDDLFNMPWTFDRNMNAQPDSAGDTYLTNELPIMFEHDQWDPQNSDIYTPGVFQYPYAEDVYISLHSLFRWYPGPAGIGGASGLTSYLYEKDSFKEKALERIKHHRYFQKGNDGPLEIQIAVSRNGVLWNRPIDRTYISLGINGEDDSGSMYMLTGIINEGNKLYQYYTGYKGTHGDFDPVNYSKLGVIKRIVQRLDGFMCLETDYRGGNFITPSIVFEGNELQINIDCGAIGEAKVAILDEQGLPIKGFGFQQCDPIDKNETGYTVTWQGISDLSILGNVPIRLHFNMRSSKLFAFQFCKK